MLIESSKINFSHWPESSTASEPTNKIVEFQKIEYDNFYMVSAHNFCMCVCVFCPSTLKIEFQEGSYLK